MTESRFGGLVGRLLLTAGVPLTVAAVLGFLNVWLLGDYRAAGVSLVSGVCSTFFTFVWLSFAKARGFYP